MSPPRAGSSGAWSPLAPILERFAEDPTAARRLLRIRLEDSPEDFAREAAEILPSLTVTSGFLHLAGLLAKHKLLFRVLWQGGFREEQDLAVVRAAVESEPAADVQLARELAEHVTRQGGANDFRRALRFLDILDEVSDGARLFAPLVKLLRAPDGAIRSKVVLILGRRSRSAAWVRQRLTDEDARTRANALEALWGLGTEEARELMGSAARDRNNRVAGNALLGLYRMGDIAALAATLEMSRHEQPGFRSTAAWVMGETADPRFREPLGLLLKETDPAVRKQAFAAFRKLRECTVRQAQAPPCRLGGRLMESPKAGVRRLQLAVEFEGVSSQPPVQPIQFMVSEDRLHAMNYRVLQVQRREPVVLAWLLPATGASAGVDWSDLASACLRWKQPPDRWICQAYSPDGMERKAGETAEESFPLTDPASILRAFAAPRAAAAPDLWHSLWRTLRGAGGAGAPKAILAFSAERVGGRAGPDLVSSVLSFGTHLRVFSLCEDPALEDLCVRTGSTLTAAGGIGEVAEAASQVCLDLRANYEITWPALSPESRAVTVRVRHPAGCGERSFDLPRAAAGA